MKAGSCSHEGHKLGAAMGHLKKMNAEHGRPAAAGNKPVGGAKQSTKMVKAAGKMGRRGA